jgi:hypothetical protein
LERALELKISDTAIQGPQVNSWLELLFKKLSCERSEHSTLLYFYFLAEALQILTLNLTARIDALLSI